MRAEEVRNLSEQEMIQKELDLKEEFFNLRFQFFTGQLENTARLTQVKRDIARVKTILAEHKLQEEDARD